MGDDKKVDIILPVFNMIDLTKSCLESVKAHSDTPYNIILIDNGSLEPTRKFLGDIASSGNATLVRNPENLGWVKAVNQGLRLSTSPYICVMNNDTIVRTDGWLSTLIEVAEMEEKIGLVNPYFEAKIKTAPKEPFTEVDFCRGYCVLMKRKVMEKIGFLDTSYGIGYYDDHDYSLRAIRAGFRCVRANNVVVEHLRDSTFSSLFEERERRRMHEANKKIFYSKWGRPLKVGFIVTKIGDRKRLSEMLFSIARRQHAVYLWNPDRPLNMSHTNIMERAFPKFFPASVLYPLLYSKYDILFKGDLEGEAQRVNEMIDSASRS